MRVRNRPVFGCLLVLLLTQAHASASETAVVETSIGSITFRLLDDIAPRHVANFTRLATTGFYDGTTFHRVIPGYIVQGGSPTSRDSDPRNDSMGDPGYTIDAEFSDVRHRRGVVAMARQVDDENSAGSQFFFVLGHAPVLDAIRFTVFGRVTDGLEVADRMAAAPRVIANHDRPVDPIVIRRVQILTVTETPSSGARSAATVADNSLSRPPATAVATPVAPAPTPSPTATPAARSPRPTPQQLDPRDPDFVLPTPGSGGRLRVTNSLVNVRRGPGVTHPVVARVELGNELTVLQTSGRWAKVQIDEGRVGWLRDDNFIDIP